MLVIVDGIVMVVIALLPSKRPIPISSIIVSPLVKTIEVREEQKKNAAKPFHEK